LFCLARLFNSGMKKTPLKEDEIQAATRVLAETISQRSEPLLADLEAAWKQWSAGIQSVNARGMTLLRAAFEAGAEAARASNQP
jgi:hypothetical protein